MKNPGAAPARRGPAPAAVVPGEMSKARALVLESLRAQAHPSTLASLASELGLHENTTREHLDALIGAGLAVRSSAAPAGRGRPAMLYQASEVDPLASADLAGLAAVLASAVTSRKRTARAAAVAAGETWGHDLVRRRRAASPATRAGERRQLVAVHDDLGFAPESDARVRRIRLRQCPWLDVATLYPDVVCRVHEGVARGAFAELGGDPGVIALEPFSSAGACELHLLPR